MTRVAYFTPLNPQRSGIADYNEELLPYLAEYLDIDLFIDAYQPSNLAIKRRFKIWNYQELPGRRAQYDVCVYHMGNNPYHIFMYDVMEKFPGVVLFHDGILHHLFWYIAVNLKRPEVYKAEMAYAYGTPGAGLAELFLQTKMPRYFDYPLIYGLANRNWMALTHNAFVKRRLENAGVTTPIHQVPFPFTMSVLRNAPLAAKNWRAKYGIAPDKIVLAVLGQIIPGKRVQQSLQAFAEARQTCPELIYCLVGEITPEVPLSDWIRALGLPSGSIIVTGHVSFDEFQHAVAATDICINLRYPTTGETSASLIRVLGMGCPTIVSNVGSFAELPDDVCLKVVPDEYEPQRLVEALITLARSPERRQSLGAAAKRFIESTGDIRQAARAQAELIRAAQPRDPTPLPALLPMRPAQYLDAGQWPTPRAYPSFNSNVKAKLSDSENVSS